MKSSSFLSQYIILAVPLIGGMVLSPYAFADDKVTPAEALVQQGVIAQKEGDETLAFQSFQKAADLGDGAGEYKLGKCYFDGKGVEKDFNAAFGWFQKSANQGNAAGENALASCYQVGSGVTRDLTKAMKLYRKAADQHNPIAEDNLGLHYEYGVGVSKDMGQAVQWFRRAAADGNPNGAIDLGNCYFDGKGVTKDENQAVTWYQKAAETGDAYSENFLGSYYADNTSLKKDDAEAVKWFQKAAIQGYAGAEENLAIHYEKGLGVTQDMNLAKVWYKKAADQENLAAKDALERLEESPTLIKRANDDTFEKQVLKATVPVLVDYYAVWCGPCKEYAPIIDKIAREYKGKLKVVRINLDDCPKLAKQYKITSIPDTFIFNKGQMVYQWLGMSTQEEVESNLAKKVNLAQCSPGADEELKGENAYDAKDYTHAMNWFKKAAAKGNSDGEAAIGFMYLQGDGVMKNDKLAM